MSDDKTLIFEGEQDATDENKDGAESDTSESGEHQEEETKPLNLEKPEKKETSNLSEDGQAQLKRWVKNINNEVKGKSEIEDAPRWLQERLRKELEKQGLLELQVQKVPDDLKSFKKQIKEELREDQHFDELKNKLNALHLSKSKQQIIESSFKSLAEENIPLGRALQLAALEAKVDLDDDNKNGKMKAMRLPGGSISSRGEKLILSESGHALARSLGISGEDIKKYGKKS